MTKKKTKKTHPAKHAAHAPTLAAHKPAQEHAKARVHSTPRKEEHSQAAKPKPLLGLPGHKAAQKHAPAHKPAEVKKEEKHVDAPKREAKTEYGGLVIRTAFDSLLDLVNEKGSLKASEAAAALGVKAEAVEEWARILASRKKVELKYSLFSGVRIRKP